MITPKDALIKIAKQYRLHIYDITIKSKDKASHIKACINLKEPEASYIMVPIELWLSQTDPVPDILENLSYLLSLTKIIKSKSELALCILRLAEPLK